MNKIRYTDKQIADALTVCGGDITAASHALHCDRTTVYIRIQRSEELQQVLDSEREKALDIAESALMKLVRQEKFDAIKFLLSTKGKKRGYTEHQEIDVNAGVTINIGKEYDEV